MGLPVAEKLPLIELNPNEKAIFDPAANVKSNLAAYLPWGTGIACAFSLGAGCRAAGDRPVLRGSEPARL
jgi:hypothetical protein